MMLFNPGQRVEYQHHCSAQVFRGNLVKFLCKDKWYAVVESGERQYLVRTDRLRHVGGCRPEGRAA